MGGCRVPAYAMGRSPASTIPFIRHLSYTCAQVVMGGKNKYLINGAAVQASQVQNLFHSVQLNVNNPHFLIMQGRITKVWICM